MKKWQRIVICLALCVTILTMSISVFATDPSPSPSPSAEIDEGLGVYTDRLISYYIWMCLKVWGINISYNEFWDWGNNDDAIVETITRWVFLYLEEMPSAYSISTWVAPWQAELDYWGNLKCNSSMLEDVQDFADWLIDYLGLVDNEHITINDGLISRGVVAYQFPIAGYFSNYPSLDYNVTCLDGYYGNERYEMYAIITGDNSLVPFTLYLDNDADCCLRYYDPPNGAYQGSNLYSQFIISDYVLHNNVRYEISPYYANPAPFEIETKYGWVDFYISDSYKRYTEEEALNALVNGFEEEGDTSVITEEIILPDEDPDYTEGDGLIIYDDGSYAYLYINWPESIAVSNLPAIVSTNDVDNPGLIEFFRPISALIDMAKTPIEIMVQIIYRFPAEVNVCIVSVMGAICILGIIKIMREH